MLKKPRLFPIYIGTQQRERLFRLAKTTARARSETRTAFFLRALAREVLRRQAEVPGLLLDRNELAVLAMLTPEERREYGL
jgi:hypothetical protein